MSTAQARSIAITKRRECAIKDLNKFLDAIESEQNFGSFSVESKGSKVTISYSVSNMYDLSNSGGDTGR